MAQLLVLRSLPGLDFIRVRVHGFINGFHDFLLPALGDDQREVLVELLVAIEKLVIVRNRGVYGSPYLRTRQCPNRTQGRNTGMAYNRLEQVSNCDKSLPMTTKQPGPTDGCGWWALCSRSGSGASPQISLPSFITLLLMKAPIGSVFFGVLKDFFDDKIKFQLC